MAHQKDAAAAGTFEILRIERIGHRFRIEPLALVLDFDEKVLRGDLIANVNGFGRVLAITVFDGVDEGLLEGEADAEAILLGEAHGLHLVEELIDEALHFGERPNADLLPAREARVAGHESDTALRAGRVAPGYDDSLWHAAGKSQGQVEVGLP